MFPLIHPTGEGYIMQVKRTISALLLIFSTFSLYGDDTLITVSPYSSGEMSIPGIKTAARNNDPNDWYPDTISFSSGTKITFMALNQMITRGMVFGIGGLVFIDTVSTVYYKFNNSLEKKLEYWNPSEYMQGMYTNTENNPDTNWNEAMIFPDNVASCDTFVIGIWGPDSLDTLIFLKSRCIYSKRVEITSNATSTTALENYNGILYVKGLNDVHLKFQVHDFKILYTGMHEWPDTIKLFWAADSCGNGIFKHDPTSNKPINKIETKCNDVFISNHNSIKYLHLSKRLKTDKECRIEIYNLKGRRIFQKRITHLETINLSHLHSGVYLARITTGREKFIYNFVLTD